jgi:putative intracellular protease/amidase
VKAFLADSEAIARLQVTHKVSELKEGYDALFVIGGHGALWDLSNHPAVGERVERTWAEGGIISALGHGPAAFLAAKAHDGEPLVRGKHLTAFSDDEERVCDLDEVVPFFLESKLTQLGAFYSQSEVPMQPHVVRDGRLITGQNQASTRILAEQVLAVLRGRTDAAGAET